MPVRVTGTSHSSLRCLQQSQAASGCRFRGSPAVGLIPGRSCAGELEPQPLFQPSDTSVILYCGVLGSAIPAVGAPPRSPPPSSAPRRAVTFDHPPPRAAADPAATPPPPTLRRTTKFGKFPCDFQEGSKMRISDEAFRSTPAVSSTQIRQMRLKESARAQRAKKKWPRAQRAKEKSAFFALCARAPGLGR